MYIQPTGNLILISGSPCDADYTNTLWFENATAQYNYFYSKRKSGMVFNDFNTIRVNGGTIRVPVNSERLYDVNYLMFQNAHFADKWFYAFVNKVNYISNGMCELEFSIDVMQTWFFDYKNNVNSTYVEREHTITDEIGDNIVPENLDTGELVFNNYRAIDTPLRDIADLIIILAVIEIDGEVVDGNLYDGLYGASTLYAFTTTTEGIDNLNNKIEKYKAQNFQNVVGIYVAPKMVFPLASDSGVKIPYGDSASSTDYILADTIGSELDGYTPKNNKLYTFPYNFLHVDNASGSDLSLRYEFFNGSPTVNVSGCLNQPVQLVLRPTGYKGTREQTEIAPAQTLNTEMIALPAYPQCSFGADGYKTWLAQNLMPIALGTIKNVALTASGAYVSSSMLAVSTGLRGISKASNLYRGMKAEQEIDVASSTSDIVTGLLSTFHYGSLHADFARGSLNNGSVNIANGKQNFFVGRMSVNNQTAKIIDSYFHRFGYAVNRTKIPTLNNRDNWTYIKTVGCTINVSIPTDDEKLICSIFDKGVTFWNNGDNVGKYYLDNKPHSEE